MPWSVADYSTNPGSNTSINGIDIDEGCAAAGYNNALRQMMADIRNWTNTYAIVYPITVGNGGTGAADAASARSNLGAFAAAGGAIGGPSSINGALTRVGHGVHPYLDGADATGGCISVRQIGTGDPGPGAFDMVFEW